MGPFSDGNRVVVVFPVSVRDPEEALHRVCQKAYGKSYRVLVPWEKPDEYESAYEVVAQNLESGEAVTVLDRGGARVTFFTPKREDRAWSAWIRVVDISSFLYN